MSAATETHEPRYQRATHRSGTPRLSRAKGPILPALDKTRHVTNGLAVADRAVDRAEAKAPGDLRVRARAAAKALATATAAYDDAYERRLELYLSLTLHNNVRGLADLAGMSQMTGNIARARRIGRPLPQMGSEDAQRRAMAAGIFPVPDVDEAVAEFAEVCVKALRSGATRDRARWHRDEAVRAMAAAGVTQDEIADVIGRKRPRVSQIVNRKG